MNSGDRKDVRAIMLETDLVEQGLHKAVVQAMMRHRRLGYPIVVWRDGKVAWIPAAEISLPDEATGVETKV